MKTSLPISGRCACGNIAITCHALPGLMFQCHCRDCQRATGSLFAPNVWFALDSVEISGELSTYEVQSDAGSTVNHDYCKDCGSSISMRTSNNPASIGLRAAVFDDMDWLRPAANIYMKNSPSWEHLDPELPVIDGQPTREFIMEIVGKGRPG